MTIVRALALVALVLGAGPAAAQRYAPSFHPDQLKGPPPGPVNEVLVLGTPHLMELPKDIDLALLAPLIDRLAAWKPRAIATEDLSGLQCDALRRYPARYAETVTTYCFDPASAGKALGLDVPAANAEVERTLARWPTAPTAADRRRLAALFLAAGEPGSAMVQWLRLPAAERRAGDGLDTATAATLEKRRVRRNETEQISAPLAARLGLERLWSVDDHSADTTTPPDEEKAYGEAMAKAWDNPVLHARLADYQRLDAAIGTPGGLLALYRVLNAPGEAMRTYRSDFGAAFVEPSAGRYGRQYLGYWEVRNLRMVANIRDVLGQHPGTRLLAIVGASHKGYYEAYLQQMHDVRLVGSDAVLR